MKPRALAYPDLILFNGKIRSLVAANGIQEAIACAGGRIVATGKSDDIRRLAGPETQSIDLKGRTTIPGLTDTHVHLSEKGTAEMELIDCRDFYTDVHSIADILERLAKRAADAPKGSWIVAHGSPMQDFRLNDKRFPTKHDLDRAIPDHLVSISFGAHITVGNSKALEAAKITRDTPDPAGGAIHKDPQTGEPTGELHESAVDSEEGRAGVQLSSIKRRHRLCLKPMSGAGRDDGSRHRPFGRACARLSRDLPRRPDACARKSSATRHRVEHWFAEPHRTWPHYGFRQ